MEDFETGEVGYLVGGIAYADVKVGQIHLYHIAQHDIQPFLLRCALHALRDFSCHARIQFYS